MKKAIAFLKALVAAPKKDYRAVIVQLETLKTDLERIQKMPNKVEAIVELFKVISPLQDAGGFSQTLSKMMEKNYGQLDQAVGALEVIQKHICNAGRNKYGFNRTEHGEEVTAAKVYLGDVFGIWSNPASYWLGKQNEFERTDSNVTPKKGCGRDYISVWYCINDYQAAPFVKNHVEGLLEKIGLLKTAFA